MAFRRRFKKRFSRRRKFGRRSSSRPMRIGYRF